jgi:nicotinamide-nucleotide amidase
VLSPETIARAEAVLALCRTRGLTVATAESCTGGLLAAALTAIAGSSEIVACGFVTYSNDAKTAMLGVPRELIQFRGAVSDEVAFAMAEGALARSGADITVAITGIAGPGGGTEAKPVGLVHILGIRHRGETSHERRQFPGDRSAVREAAVNVALDVIARLAS